MVLIDSHTLVQLSQLTIFSWHARVCRSFICFCTTLLCFFDNLCAFDRKLSADFCFTSIVNHVCLQTNVE